MENIMKKNVLDENALKAKCIDFLLSKHGMNLDDYVLVNELKFADGKRRADIVEVNGSMNVFEIKSDLDNLDRLEKQIEDYKHCFDTVTIVTTAKHIQNIKNTVSKNIGLMLVNEVEVKSIRGAISYKNFNKYLLAAFLENDCINHLIKKVNISGYSKMTITQKRFLLSKHIHKDELRECAINTIKNNYKKQFNEFIKNRGELTLTDDIQLFWHGSIFE